MPSPIEKLQKFFKLEAERGYDNRAVVGGLDKILPSWEKEARAGQISDDLVQMVINQINEYPNLEPENRAECLQSLIDTLQAAKSANGSGSPSATPSPAPAAAPSRNPKPILPPPPETQTLGRKSRTPSPRVVEAQKPAGLNASLTVLPGIGEKHAQTLRELGLATLEDLLYYFPRRYDDYSQLKPINHLAYGEELTVIATVKSASTRAYKGGQSQMTEVVVSDGTGFLRVTWFNQPWISNRLIPGTQLVLSGKIDQYLGRLVMTNPDWELIEQEHLNTNRIVPVYSINAQVTQKFLRRTMYSTVNFWAPRVGDYLPGSVRASAGVVDLSTALSNVHFPVSVEQLKAARERLAFDEIFLLQLGVLRQKRTWQSVTARIFETPDEWFDTQVNRLPFQLTGAQQKALEHIRADLTSGQPMNRLLQGDVGSGKTVVAGLAAAMVTQHGAQAAILAPTSILAEQHYRSMRRLLAEAENPEDVVLSESQIGLLIGDTPEAEKEQIRAGLADGSIKLIIGTHALLEDPISFDQLQLVVVDEQHRFGVAQRAALRSKGENPHLLVMTATPIPRSLALTVYGDLDLTVMDEMPAGRIPIETYILGPVERERAYQLIRSQVQEGRQAFIIYPLVEKGDREDENQAAVEEHARLQKEIFPQSQLGLLHGRMKPEEKEEVMTRFRDNEFSILVSTSVIEVGVDIPNATVMIIEGANRFGLAQLHQFRGRVGRGQNQSYCLLIPDNENATENQRLLAMAETNDGFVLAERDLQQRGPGDFLGTRQAGFTELKMANLTDIRLIEKAREQAQALFAIDPDLQKPEHEGLVSTLNHFWGAGRGDIS
jgi:ATP-dependent DNA helicase RecG